MRPIAMSRNPSVRPSSAQLSLPGFDVVPTRTDGLFFAIFPEVDAATRIEGLARQVRDQYALNGKPLPIGRLHVTLCPLGTYAGGLPHLLVAKAIQAAEKVVMPSFEVAFDYVRYFGKHADEHDGRSGKAQPDSSGEARRDMSSVVEQGNIVDARPGNKPLVLCGDEGVSGLQVFRQSLCSALEQSGVFRRTHLPYTPHVTLLYDRSEGRARRRLEQKVEPVGWTVREFVLVHSLLGQTRHVALRRWPLVAHRPSATD
jgi:RNA 2',3'-cyclic 3'-phosphodiesterase